MALKKIKTHVQKRTSSIALTHGASSCDPKYAKSLSPLSSVMVVLFCIFYQVFFNMTRVRVTEDFKKKQNILMEATHSEEIVRLLNEELTDKDDVLIVRANTIDERTALNRLLSQYSVGAMHYYGWRENYIYCDPRDYDYSPLGTLTWAEDTQNDRSIAMIEKRDLLIYYPHCPKERLEYYTSLEYIISIDYNAVAIFQSGRVRTTGSTGHAHIRDVKDIVSTNVSRRKANILKGRNITSIDEAKKIVDKIVDPRITRAKTWQFPSFSLYCSVKKHEEAKGVMLNLIHFALYISDYLLGEINHIIYSFTLGLLCCDKCLLYKY